MNFWNKDRFFWSSPQLKYEIEDEIRKEDKACKIDYEYYK